jgi:hypothetical protein
VVWDESGWNLPDREFMIAASQQSGSAIFAAFMLRRNKALNVRNPFVALSAPA